MYPIVLFVRFKNAKQIREIKDLRCDKITQKAAKELYDHAVKVEKEYEHLITSKDLRMVVQFEYVGFRSRHPTFVNHFVYFFAATVAGGPNISYVATQVKTAVEKEQSKTLWVPV